MQVPQPREVQADGGQRVGRPAGLDDQQRDVRPPPAQLGGDPGEDRRPFVRHRIDERQVAWLGIGGHHAPRVQRQLDGRAAQSDRPGVIPAGVLGGDQHGRSILEKAAVRISEVVQVEDHRDAPAPRPCHQGESGRVAAVGQHHVGPEAVEHLLGQVEPRQRLGPVGSPLGAAGRRRHQRHPHAPQRQVEHRHRAAPRRGRLDAPVRDVQRREDRFEGRLGLVIEHAGGQDAAVVPACGKKLEQVPRRRGGPVGGVDVAVNRREQEPERGGAHDLGSSGLAPGREDGPTPAPAPD